jgi:hypothetical protein
MELHAMSKQEIFSEFVSLLNHFKIFKESSVFSLFIKESNDEEKESWENILISTHVALEKMQNQTLTMDEILLYNYYSSKFYDEIDIKYITQDTLDALQKIMR